MAGSVNKVILVGHLGKDPELRYTTQNQTPVTRFSLATNERIPNKSAPNGFEERTEWHSVVVWGNMAKVCGQYLKRGRQVYIEGSLRTRDWTGKDGQQRKTTEIVASQVVFLGAKDSRGGDFASSDAPSSGSGYDSGAPGDFGDDTPPDGESGNTPPNDDIPF